MRAKAATPRRSISCSRGIFRRFGDGQAADFPAARATCWTPMMWFKTPSSRP